MKDTNESFDQITNNHALDSYSQVTCTVVIQTVRHTKTVTIITIVSRATPIQTPTTTTTTKCLAINY